MIRLALLSIVLAAACACLPPVASGAAQEQLLAGRITSSTGQALAGIPVQARRANSSITVTVYSNSQGEYSFPEWSALSPGSYSVGIDDREFVPVKREAVLLSSGKTARVDFALQSRQPTIHDASSSEIAMAAPGTEDQKFMLTQCGQCHELPFTLRQGRSKEQWLQVVKRMIGPDGSVANDAPGTRAFDQKRYIEPMANYLATIRGPGSSDNIPFKLLPRPTRDASTRIVVTEFEIPRGGTREPFMIRSDRRFAWPHDVAVDPNGQYIWYVDHYQFILGRLDQKTGEVKEFPYQVLPGMDRKPEELKQGLFFGGGAHKVRFDYDGKLVLGIHRGVVIFDPKTEQFTPVPTGKTMFGIDRDSNLWYMDRCCALHKLDRKTGEVKSWPSPPDLAGYDVETDSQGRFMSIGTRSAKMTLFDPKTEKFTSYPTPTPDSGPRRGNLDAKDRYWVGLYWAGRIGVFDPNKREVKEFPIVPDSKPFGAPFAAPYTVVADDKHQVAWTPDFNSHRIYLFDMKTERTTEFLMPSPYEVRDLQVDESAGRPTLWIPVYRAPAKLVKVEVR